MMWKEIISMLTVVLLTSVSKSAGYPYEVLNGNGTFDIKNSPSQTTVVETIQILFIAGQTKFDAPVTSIINDRYDCGDYAMSFSVEDDKIPGKVSLHISLPGDDVGTNDDPECDIDWGDEATDDGEKIGKNPKTIKHEYSEFGIYRIRMSCKDDHNKKVRTACPAQQNKCFDDPDFFGKSNDLFNTPQFYLSTRPIQVDSYMQITGDDCTSPTINWRITRVAVNDNFVPFINFTQPNTSVLNLPSGTLENGLYVVTLEVMFPSISLNEWTDDSFLLKVIDPELVAYISGGDYLEFPIGDELFIHADESYDPLNESSALQPLQSAWSFLVFPPSAALDPVTLNTFLVKFPVITLPSITLHPYSIYEVKAGTEYILKVETTLFSVNSYCLAMFTLTHGNRMASALQVIKIVSNVLPISIHCVYNCHIGRDRILYYDRLELDLNFPVGTNTTGFSFTWSVLQWNGALELFSSPNITIVTETGFATSSLSIKNGSFVQGHTYQIKVIVYSPEGASSTAQLVKTVNYVPSGGTCKLDDGKTTVISAREWLTFECESWVKQDPVTKGVNSNPILSFTVRQRTVGAVVEEEPILRTRSKKSFVVLKVGDPENSYETELLIRVTDIFNNYREQVLPVSALPAFAVDTVNPNEAGASIIRSYTETDYPNDEQQLRDMGKSNMMITLVSAVCSNIHLIDLGEWVPPVPRVLNTDGFVMDLNANGNKDVGTLDEVIVNYDNKTVDPATLAVQEVIAKMVRYILDIVEREFTGSTDKMLTSLVTNAFTNLVAKPRYLSYETMGYIIDLAKVVGFDALLPHNTSDDNAAQTETSSGEVYYMFQEIVQAAVPDDFVEIRPVGNLVSGRNNIDEMLIALSENISLYDSKLSPVERAYLYIRTQKHLKYNTEEKKKTAKDAADMAVQLAQEVQNQWKLCRNCSNIGNRKTGQFLQNAASEHFIKQMKNTTTSKFRIDGLNEELGNITHDIGNTVSVSAFEFQENVFMYDNDDTSSFVTSKVLRIDIKSLNTRVTPGFMTFEQRVSTPTPEYVIPSVDEEDVSKFMYHRFIYQKATDEICMIARPLGQYNFTEYLVYIKYDSVPSIIDYDFIVNIKEEHNWQLCITPEKMRNHTGLTYMALSLPGDMKTVEYNLTIATVGCLTWEESVAKWHTDKCQLEWKPEEETISCFCREITDLVFSNSFFVAPNSIDFSSVFLRFSPLNQAAVIGTFSVLFVFYFVAVIFLSGLDRRDCLKWGVTPLRDNMINDDNYYIVKVYTGMRRGAGTRSRVAFILTGSNGSTRPRELYDGVREEISTGSVMSFFLATQIELGDLLHLYIWHDNSGGSHAGWYLNQVVIYDIGTLTAYTFVAERWLSIETNLDACLVSSPNNRPIKFESRFFYQLRDRFSENHTWISILYRPQTSTFTRVQRVSCALAYIFLTMLANAMYFNPEPNYVSPAILEVGPFRFTKEQIYISIVCAALTTPPIMILVYIFQHTKRRQQNDDEHKTSSGCCRKQDSTADRDKLREVMLSSEVPNLKGGLLLPFWFVYIGWLLVLGAIFAPAFFIVLYSIEWGKQKSEEWLTTFFMSIFESILFVDPILVICIVFVLSLLMRSNTVDKSIDIQRIVERYKKRIGHNDGKLSSAIKVLHSIKDDIDTLKKDPRRVTPPYKGQEIAMAAEKHRRRTVMTTFVKDIFLNMFFIIILSSIAYANRDPRSYRHHEEIVNTIVTPWKLAQFNAIKTPGDVYNWLNISVIPSLFPEFDVNGAPLHWTVRQFTNGYNNLRLGPPRLRQLRVKNGTCKIPYIGHENCFNKYEILGDEEANFCLGWATPPCPVSEAVFNVSVDAWKYTSAFDIWGLPTQGVYTTYGGGGYIANFDVGRNISVEILNELFKNLWIDRQTRAVLFEFTLYNAVTNMFVYIVFLIEFLESGGALTSYSIYPFRIYTHHGAVGTYTLVCELIFVVYLSVLFVKTCVRIYQKRCRFFKEFWHVYELVMLLIGMIIIVFYALRFSSAHTTIDRFNKDKKLYVNFAHIVLWDQVLVSALAILVFMATLRMLEVFASSKKVNAVIRVFNECGKDLMWYSFTFLHIFFAFCIIGLLMFGSKLSSYKDIYSTMATLFIALIGKSKFTEIDDKEPVFAKFFFLLYILAVVFFVLSIFLSILGASIDNSVHDSRKDPREDLIEEIMKAVQSLIARPRQMSETVEEDTPPSIPDSPKVIETDSNEMTPRKPTPELPVDDEPDFNGSEDLDVISKMSEEDIVLPIVAEVRRIPKFRSKTQYSRQSVQPMKKPPWRL